MFCSPVPDTHTHTHTHERENRGHQELDIYHWQEVVTKGYHTSGQLDICSVFTDAEVFDKKRAER